MANKHWLSIVILALVTVFLDTMNYALIVPILPYLVKELNSTSFEEGILFSSYSIFQLISMYFIHLEVYVFINRSFNCGTFKWHLWKKAFSFIISVWFMFGIHFTGYVSKYDIIDHLALFYRTLCRISDSCSSVRIEC